MGITLPIELPITLTGGVSSRGVTLPITLPLSFPTGNENENACFEVPAGMIEKLLANPF